MKTATTTIKFGNADIKITATEGAVWERDEMKRRYFDLEENSKKRPIDKLYEVLAGGTRDNVIEVAGRTFAFTSGMCDSKTKRRAAAEAAEDLINQIATL